MQHTIITLLGSAGGVARSVLSIFNKSVNDLNDPIHPFLKNAVLHLIDHQQKEFDYYHTFFPNLKDLLVLHEFDLKDTAQFTDHLIQTKTRIVVDVSWADTAEMLKCCDLEGVSYINTALENTMIDENEDEFAGFPLIERLRRFEEDKQSITNTKAIIGSGMNPGVVQWMALELMKIRPDQTPLACYIVEHDSSFFKNKQNAEKDTIYTTWSPECFLDEAISSYPMFMKNKAPLFLYENVYDLEFQVTLGKKQFNGCLMPHEEVYTLCRMYDMEGGFFYKINDHTTDLIRSNLYRSNDLWNFEMKVLDPLEGELEGEDLVGVLLVYENEELYMYNVLDNESVFAEFQTNATYFQVACGIYAGLSVLLKDQLANGVYYVDELLQNTKNQYGVYLAYYMTEFVSGKNKSTDGLLLQRMKSLR
ncbi:S-adenosylmethionine decarboxylase related protein [Bacillus sp. V2I10]|uniref:S-adenosylmethionine decarboxylase related protein n=1 Tax=Bacillus sp. V2I10 TaxID=3042276 RepID=UPI0027830B0A|nr:S-adenosylmethionine decarboxylase related protein [Bacillus sp. V2I10]MDQ0860610.1 homospermidine synthase [Bacillus sp. V2I10]